MPELPDVACFRQYIDATALHQEIAAVHAGRTDVLDGTTPQALGRRLDGRSFRATRRHGKYLFVALDDGGYLVMHFGMTGYPAYARSDHDPPEHTRLRVEFRNGHRLAYVCQRLLGHVTLAADIDAFVQEQGLGPDALSLDEADLSNRLRPHRGMVKPVLMDQSVVAGLGNVYTDEILFHARIHPRARIAGFDAGTCHALHRAMCHVLQRAIRDRADPQRMPASWLLPHREEGDRCPRCDGGIRQLRVGGRSTYVCPRCQSGD